ncbi:hypothetical protein CANCADRAFT_32063 [Tortispora caseinolytica NRRL Y-17796]|uniref:CN hydrolase domain-containing protein n=1 Tax=Tortispora caseinolytica NRRL Y-17796 TaxID=767744 RepID=A0A1E4TI51_9ASCO|nr:hypothetical protein CANCADRAFT_32063 [Tortispora caseinolytica NRRL Y-17796]
MALAAVGQFCATASVEANLSCVKVLIDKAIRANTAVLFLPEASDYIGTPQGSGFVEGLCSYLSEKASSLFVSVGVHEIHNDNNKSKNSLLWITPDGHVANRYTKLHLFDAVGLKESDRTIAGSEVVKPFDSPIGVIGPAICYDMRFPELALRLRRLGAEIITFPSAFTLRTGADHWETLIRARAIDTQCYIMAAALTGRHNEKRESWGHSMIVDPWGTVIAQCPNTSDPCIAIADINLEYLHQIRYRMPLWDQRRTDIFGEI